MRLRFRRCDARGSVPLEFILGMGFLLLPMALLVLQIPRWLDRVHLAQGVALESARLCAQADTLAEGQEAAAAFAAMNPHVRSVRCWGAVDQGSVVEADAEVEIPALTVPIFGIDTGNFTITRRHAERVDQYRSFGP